MLVSLAIAGAITAGLGCPAPRQAEELTTLEGTWVMESAFEIHPDSGRSTAYGEHPNGLLIVDAAGRYSLQIYNPDRPGFVSGDKARGAPEEYRAAALGSSTHFGRVAVDSTARQLRFTIEGASFPNWEGRTQIRDYSFDGGLLSYAVPSSASSSGVVAHSRWRRVQD